jgi:ribosomal-protein-alanine N-acetyltransferase
MAAKPKHFFTGKPSRLLPMPLIRRVRRQDASVVTEIAQRSKTAAAWSTEDVQEMLESTGILALLSERSGTITGFLFARQVADEAELLNIAVRKDFRGKGDGSAILSAAFAELREARVRRIFLEVRESNRETITFYRKRGFCESGRRKAYYRDPREDAICMEKKITL